MSTSSAQDPDNDIRQLNDAGGTDLVRSAEFQGLAELRNLIDQHFSLEEIQTLCFDMQVEFEHLAGNTRPLKIQNLIVYLAQRQLLPQLLDWLQQQRPNVSWELAQSAHWPPLPADEPSESVIAFAAERPGRMTQYLDFEVEVGEGIGQDYPVNVIRSPAGKARETMHFPYDELALENRLQSLQIALLHAGGGQRQMLTAEEQLVQEFGRDLFNALFTGEARSRFDVSCAEARQQGKGLRMKLRILPPEMARLPWEFLYDPRRAEYICLSRETPIIRYLELPQPIQPLEVVPPLRILGMTVSPSDLPRLDVPREKQRVEMALRPLQASGAVQLTWLSGATWRDLHRAMRAGPWHIFHFIGHGGFDSQADEGFIALADEKGRAQRLLATELGRLLADHYSLRLVLLNSCEGARGSEHDIFSSAAAILVRRGLPAVLAMQYTITDRAAIEFSRAFYEAMVDNLPVDAAVAEARKAVSLAKTYTVEWGTPVLFMRAPKGVIFNISAPSQVPLAKAQETDDELERRLEQLYTDGLGAYWVEDWDKACRCFQSILDVRPAYVDASTRLAEAQRQQKLAALYDRAVAAGEDWPVAIAALEELVADMPDYRDAQFLLVAARQQKQLADLYTEAHRLWEAGQWQAVVNVFGQIRSLEPDYPDPDELLATAERELVEVKRQEELNKLYGRAVRELDAGNWDEARLLLANIAEMEPDYRDTERLLARADEAAAREEAKRQKQAQVATWYEQALGLAQAAQWPQVLAKMQEIWALDPDFVDPEGLNGRAQAEIERAETEAALQTELAALYAEAVNQLKAQEYQAALDKWREVQGLDPRYRDRQKVQRTAKKKLRQLNQTAKPRRHLDKRLVWLAPLAAIILIAVALLLLNPFDGGAGQEITPSSMPVVASGLCPVITGWQAEYWDNTDLQGDPVSCRDEQAVSFTWGRGPGPGVPSDNFSARFTQTIDFPGGNTRFYLSSDDGSRLWVDDVLLIDQWHAGPTEAFSDLNMSAGDHNLRLEYFEISEGAGIDFSWTTVEACAPGVIYCEDFRSGDAPGWRLEEGWRVGLENGNHVLQGENHQFAILQHQGWDDYRLCFRLKLQQGGIYLNFRYSEDNTRYFVSFNESWLQLSRQRGPYPTNIVTLARAMPAFSLDRWYDVEIVGEGGHIQVFVDGNLELEFRDNDPVLQGSIAFETLDNSSALIDDLEVLPIQSSATSAPAVVDSGLCPEITGWQTEYWDNTDLQGDPVLCRDEQAVSFTWGRGPGPGVPSDNFSARFTQTIDFPGGNTRFYLSSDDGSRLWVDDVLLIDQWHAGPTEAFSDLNMSAGDHDLRLEYFEISEGAEIDFSWTAVEDCAPGVIYCEDFRNGDAPGWRLEEGWRVGLENGNHLLQGENHHFAILNHQGWEDYRLRFRLKLQQGGIHLNFRYNEDNTRYFITFGESWLALDRQRGPYPTNIVTLARAMPAFSLDRWYDVEIVGEGGYIQVFVDGNLELEFRDNDPVLQGTISFETFDDSSALIDDVEVLPIQSQD